MRLRPYRIPPQKSVPFNDVLAEMMIACLRARRVSEGGDLTLAYASGSDPLDESISSNISFT